ncbi:hypothetical protein B0T21DRAFT_316828 [Apiosordaria backusii]|uniref:Uncharacterized protein n=1 Tax=Apiosordaria backusii TaxID=314023 RepID=A0AA40ASH5_9PEZI|nr:hypothetical protein B0T21DRAFT_316828 [Apiosordaria backusii]
MASQTPPALPARPLASPGSGHIEPVWLDFSTIEEIIAYIINARHRGSESILSFQWQADRLDYLFEELDTQLVELDQSKIRRFEYDYESGTVHIDIMGESEFHYQVQAGLRDYIKNRLAERVATTDDPTIRRLMQSIEERGTFNILHERKIHKQADSEPRKHVERKARQYINCSDGKIRVALILDLQYPHMKKAWVSLLVAGSPSSGWVQHSELYHDDDLVQQPVGQVDLYLSDFVSLAGVPTAFCRPSTVELAAGVTRNPTITITFERLRAIFRRARHLHSPAKFTMQVTDREENPYEEAERRVAEERSEAERCAAEAERRVAEARSEARIEIERLVAEGRLGAK